MQNSANTDAAEAVFAGLLACVDDLVWRPHAARLIVLLGDAPPHACGASAQPYPDRFPEADPSGMTLMSMSARVEMALVTLHALGMLPSPIPTHDRVTEACFDYLARSTGGTYRTARLPADALALVEEIGRREFGQLEFDRRLWSLIRERRSSTPTTLPETQLPELEQELGVSLYQLHAGLDRLRKRGLAEPKEDA